MRRWTPLGSTDVHVSDVEEGSLVGWPWRSRRRRDNDGEATKQRPLLPDYFMPWRVVSVTEVPRHDWSDDERARHDRVSGAEFRRRVVPRMVILRGAGAAWPSVNTHMTGDVHLRFGDEHLWVLPARYPVCSCCGQLVPCLLQWAEDNAAATVAAMDRYLTAGVCPACGEVVTRRQQSVTFPENLHVPVGPAVTFHLRRRCVYSAIRYEDAYAARHPDWPRRWPTCAGATIVHADGSYTCSAGPDACPGSHARHNVMSVCRDPDCEARCRGNVLSCTPRRGMVWRDAP